MADNVERKVGDLILRIDRDLCVGFKHCTDESPTTFRLGDYDVVEFAATENEERPRLIAAAGVCPVDARCCDRLRRKPAHSLTRQRTDRWDRQDPDGVALSHDLQKGQEWATERWWR